MFSTSSMFVHTHTRSDIIRHFYDRYWTILCGEYYRRARQRLRPSSAYRLAGCHVVLSRSIKTANITQKTDRNDSKRWEISLLHISVHFTDLVRNLLHYALQLKMNLIQPVLPCQRSPKTVHFFISPIIVKGSTVSTCHVREREAHAAD